MVIIWTSCNSPVVYSEERNVSSPGFSSCSERAQRNSLSGFFFSLSNENYIKFVYPVLCECALMVWPCSSVSQVPIRASYKTHGFGKHYCRCYCALSAASYRQLTFIANSFELLFKSSPLTTFECIFCRRWTFPPFLVHFCRAHFIAFY